MVYNVISIYKTISICRNIDVAFYLCFVNWLSNFLATILRKLRLFNPFAPGIFADFNDFSYQNNQLAFSNPN